jgi:hypothetical protein
MKRQIVFKHAARWGGEAMAFAGLGFAGIVMIFFASSSMMDLAASGDAATVARCDADPVCLVTNSCGHEVSSVAHNPPTTIDAVGTQPSAAPGIRLDLGIWPAIAKALRAHAAVDF